VENGLALNGRIIASLTAGRADSRILRLKILRSSFLSQLMIAVMVIISLLIRVNAAKKRHRPIKPGVQRGDPQGETPPAIFWGG